MEICGWLVRKSCGRFVTLLVEFTTQTMAIVVAGKLRKQNRNKQTVATAIGQRTLSVVRSAEGSDSNGARFVEKGPRWS
jgi:hypothetical protein